MPIPRRPLDLEQLIRGILRRLDRLERRRRIDRTRVGPWILETGPDGELVARNRETGERTTLAP